MADATKGLTYPSPTIVVGVGRFGLASLERLAEDWHRLEQSSEDASVRNLRLIHVRSAPNEDPHAWRDAERHFVDIARYTGEGDLPSLALDFVILRVLGLVRYREGTYQVAMPRDAGLVEKGMTRRVVRRRYFEWLTLHPDPIASSERLDKLTERRNHFGLFVRPIVNRVLQGHSPRALLRCISRVRALVEGRDPSPWGWILDATQRRRDTPRDGSLHLGFDTSWITRDDLRGLLEGFAPEPIPSWGEWFRHTHHDWVHDPEPHEVDLNGYAAHFDIHVPQAFVPTPRDLPSPLDPKSLLRIDWEANGWATEVTHPLGEIEFTPVDASAYRLGLFDHDSSSRVHDVAEGDFGDRLSELGVLAHRGLVRLWVDLQRMRVEDQHFDIIDTRRKEGIDETLHQSLEVLGELVVRPLLSTAGDEEAMGGFPERRGDDWVDGEDLPAAPSEFLSGLEVARRGSENEARSALTERLIALGFTAHEADIEAKPLLSEIELVSADLSSLDIHEPRPAAPGHHEDAHGLLRFRRVLNEQTRHLFEHSFLSEYRNRPTRRPPRLTIYMVGDVEEPFVRTTARALLREMHAELLRAYAPIFESFREGFDRSLCILPILWMPHPADAFGGLHPLENRCEEASIIESIQGIRRWVETVPRGTRCIPQVMVNSRVTDNAVLSKRDAVQQTRDFMTFQIRNDPSHEPWLRRTVVGPSGDDFFASFSCHEVEFPAERAREYLANRLARDMVRQIKRGEAEDLPEVAEEDLAPPQAKDLLRPSTARTRKQTRRAADTTELSVEERVSLTHTSDAQSLMRAYNEEFEEEILGQITDQWRRLTRSRGDMDGMMDDLRRETSGALADTMGVVRRHSDELIETHAARGGLKSTQAGFQQLMAVTRESLMEAEQLRQRAEELCRRHRIPRTEPVKHARADVVDAAAKKPDHRAMRFGLLVWLLLAPGIAAPLCYVIAKAAKLHLDPHVLEFVLGPLGPIVGALIFFAPVWWLLRRHMSKIVERIHQKIQHLGQTAREVVEGAGSSLGGAPSIRSFIEARLNLTAALSTRNFATRVHEGVIQDSHLANRLVRSVDIQQDVLSRRAEDLGVRAQMVSGAGYGDAVTESVDRLFATRDGRLLDFLVKPDKLQSYYLRRWGDRKERRAFAPVFIEEVGGFGPWREQACMSDSDRILQFARSLFAEIVAKPVAEQYTFEEDIGEALTDFVAKYYSNMGFGAKFSGYEGLDPDGVQVVCEAALVIHPALRRVFEEARRRPGAKPFTETLDILETPIIPNSAYMLSLAQGIRPHSLRNLTRFESYHDRVTLPDDRVFPVSGESAQRDGVARPINHLTGFEALRGDFNASIFAKSRQRRLRHEDPAHSAEVDEADAGGVGLVDLRAVIPTSELTAAQLAGIPQDLERGGREA